MTDIEWMNIPRIYTAAAEWCACMVYILQMKRRRPGKISFWLGSLLVLVCQGAFLLLTDGLDGWRWILCMLIAAAIMFLFLYGMADCRLPAAAYVTVCAFLLAEFVAALFWQLQTYPMYFGFTHRWLHYLIWVVTYALLFVCAYFLEREHLSEGLLDCLKWGDLLVVVGIAAITFLGSNFGYALPDSPVVSHASWDIFQTRTLIDFIGIAVVYSYQNRIVAQIREEETDIIKAALKRQYDQYLAYQAGMEFIQIKYHDLKHQIAGLRAETDAAKRTEWIDSIEREVTQHELTAPCGNAVLDAILGAKLLRAKNQNIRFTFVADGKLLEFMHVMDICTIFGNGLDNALEAVSEIDDPEKRLIHFTVSEKKGFLLILISNYCARLPQLGDDGIPITTKAEKENHGFGIKSIKIAAQKYQGTVTVDTADGWFKLRILIPLAEE